MDKNMENGMDTGIPLWFIEIRVSHNLAYHFGGPYTKDLGGLY